MGEGMSLYTLDGTTRKLLRPERFGGSDFSVKSFIEQLSDAQRHLDEDRRLDPKPYIRTFESAAAELERLHDIALTQEEAASTQVSQLSEKRNLEIQDLVANVQTTLRDVKLLDETSAEIQQSSGQVGQHLEVAAQQHAQISEYRALISAYCSFLAGKENPPELTRESDMRKSSAFMAQLQRLSTAIGKVEGQPDVQTLIDKKAETLETQLLDRFLINYQNFDLAGMREVADILFEYNGGGAVVQAYINQHRFFMSVDQLMPEEGGGESARLWQELANPTASIAEFSEIVEKQVQEITDTIGRETEIILKVFPKPTKVLSMFIQRTFVQKIQEMVNKYMDMAAEQANPLDSNDEHEVHDAKRLAALAQVRVLSVCHTHFVTLVNDMQTIWSKPQTGLSTTEQSELGGVLDSNFTDAFVPHTDEYFSLEEAALAAITDREFRLAKRQKSENSVIQDESHLDRLRKMWNARHQEEEDVTESESLMGPAGSTPLHLEWQRLQNIPIGTVQNILSAFGEAIAREQLLRHPDQFAADATALYKLLTHEMGRNYISPVIDLALEISAKVDARAVIDWSFLKSVRTSGHALRLVAAFVKTVLFATVQASPEAEASMAAALNAYILNVQRSCAALVERTADLMRERTKQLFGKNSRRDFLEPPESEEGLLHPDLLDEMHNLSRFAKESLSTENCNRLLRYVAMNFCSDLLEHILQFSISRAGGAALSTDVAEFERLMTQDWGLSGDVSEQFATLRAIARLYTADESLLSSLLRDSHLARLTPGQLRAYLGQRSDNNAKAVSMLYFNTFQYSKRY